MTDSYRTWSKFNEHRWSILNARGQRMVFVDVFVPRWVFPIFQKYGFCLANFFLEKFTSLLIGTVEIFSGKS